MARLFALVGLLASLVGPASAQAPAAVLDRDLRLLEAWLPGEWDNAEQHFFSKEAGAAVIPRRRLTIVAEGPRRVAWTEGAPRSVVLSVDAERGVIVSASPDCRIAWTRRAGQFEGEAMTGGCGGASTRYVLSAEELWLGQSHLRRARTWTCWMAIPREGKPDSWFYARDLTVLDQGGEAWITTDDPQPRTFGYRLRQVRWPSGTNQDALTLYVLKKGEDRAPGYAWASPDATRIGVNLRWMQGSCARSASPSAP